MGSWLRDTVQAAEYLAASMEKARSAPQFVARELHAYAMALTEETSNMIETIQRKGQDSRSGSANDAEGTRLRGVAAAVSPGSPPSCNTGGKVPKTQTKARPAKPGFPLPPASVQAYADNNGFPPKGAK